MLPEQYLHGQRHSSHGPYDAQQRAQVDASDEEDGAAGQAEAAVGEFEDEGEVHDEDVR